MIRTTSIPEGYELKPWDNRVDFDAEAKLWVVNQLMGETEKGDVFSFALVAGSATGHKIDLYTGILYGSDGRLKALIPANLTVKHDGVFTNYEYTGLVGETTADVEAEYREVMRDGDIDQAVREWFLKG